MPAMSLVSLLIAHISSPYTPGCTHFLSALLNHSMSDPKCMNI